ncbi:MAG: phage tail sheath family protein [Pseudobutyrivibrio ruminis]|uniref:Phage tail sheath family protein n=1 Tax=Pseudobutyrivibrio ruminis TaxID=46206 RepID=A0A927YPC5_9FIRM|nr:phage tail sheath family protein [Pseudobutyrivibrio ruminis]
MAEYFSPGVYVEEYDNSPRSVEGIGTSTAGFVGLAEKGPTKGAPLLVTNFKNFQKLFGGFLSEYTHGEYRYLANSVEQFFVNGGTRCYVARVAPEDAVSASKKMGILTVTAANEGKWGNRIQVSLSTVIKRKMQLLEKVSDTVFKAKAVDGFREGDIVEFNGEFNRIAMIYDEQVTFEGKFKGDPVDVDVIPKKVVKLVTFDIQVRFNDEIENYFDVTINPSSPAFIESKLANSNIVKVEVQTTKATGKDIVNPVEAILGKGVTEGTFTLEGGSDGSIAKVNGGTFIGKDDGPSGRTGIQAFLENTNVNIMAVPGVTIPEVVVALVAHCENTKSRFAVIDMPKDQYKTDDLINYRGMIDSTYAAMYHPWIQVFDRSSNKPDYIPPSGAVMGVYSRTDIARGVHKAPANEVVFCTGLKVNYTKGEQDILNPEGINLIRAIPGEGIRVWGARTASSNSSFKYVNIRRLFIYVMESIKASTNWVVFEPNDTTLWSRVALTITSFLDGMWRTGMLAGSSPSEAFFVEIGSSTMSADDIRNGRLICNIGIAPSRPAEFVIFRLTQRTSETGGEGGGAAEEG